MVRYLLPFVALLAGCSLGPISATPSGDIAATAARGNAIWQVIDLQSGAVVPYAALPDLAADPVFRDRLLAVRLVPAGDAALGSAAQAFARQDDESPTTVASPGCYIAAFELTRAQWRRIAGTTPWTAVAPAGADDLPATGMTFLEARTALAAWSATHPRLALPSGVEWEIAARGGSTDSFPWGDDRRASVAGAYALTWDSDPAATGPDPVGRRLSNGLGLFDVAGNVWELTAEGAIRGGSWGDALALARPANRAAIEPDTAHPTVGLRVVYRP